MDFIIDHFAFVSNFWFCCIQKSCAYNLKKYKYKTDINYSFPVGYKRPSSDQSFNLFKNRLLKNNMPLRSLEQYAGKRVKSVSTEITRSRKITEDDVIINFTGRGDGKPGDGNITTHWSQEYC